MTIGFGTAGSILTEQPPRTSSYVPQRARDATPHAETGAGTTSLLGLAAPELPLVSVATLPPRPASTSSPPVATLIGPHITSLDDFEVVYDDAAGRPMIAFSEGQWYDVTGHTPRPISVRNALRRDAAWAGAVVQTVCLWMRSSPRHERSFDLATELALAVGELARQQH